MSSDAPAITTASIQSSSSSLWERITTWASEHKAVVYTVAGAVVVVSGAGVVYYLSDSKSGKSSEPRKSKKERRKEKKKAEEEKKGGINLKDEEAGSQHEQLRNQGEADDLPATSKIATVEAEEDELPEITESTVDNFSAEVRMLCLALVSLLNISRTKTNMRQN